MTREGSINLGHRKANCENRVVQEVHVNEDAPSIEQNYVVFSHHNLVEVEETTKGLSHQSFTEYF